MKIYLLCRHRQVCCGSCVCFRAAEFASELCVCVVIRTLVYCLRGVFDLF